DAQTFSLNERFDTIVSGELIEHLSNPGQFLARAQEHIKPNGRVVLTTPYVFGLANILYAILKFPKTCSNSEHTLWFCPTTFIELATRYDFKVVHWELVEDYYDHVPSWKYRILVAFLRILGPIIPKRIKANSMLFVLQPNAESTQ
ncbi:methyltransferase domain-containing protein, partial [Candidatus Parcubacteria bacterium]